MVNDEVRRIATAFLDPVVRNERALGMADAYLAMAKTLQQEAVDAFWNRKDEAAIALREASYRANAQATNLITEYRQFAVSLQELRETLAQRLMDATKQEGEHADAA
jgi:hypothetical protein